MAVGWAGDDSVSQQIQNTIDDEISEKRRLAIKGVRFCIGCQSMFEHVAHRHSLFNRRASKDSQLRQKAVVLYCR